MLEIGTLLGNRYEIIKKIGAGGMSVVYKAKCQKLNRFVAIKVLREEFANDDTFVTKFRVEAQAAASLSHPNIINVFDVGSDGDTHFIVMELTEGVTLQQYIRQNGPLSAIKTLEIAIKIAKALKTAHANKIVHRDIKPQNIIISNKGDVKVTDFGIARAASSSTITSSANAIGSVHYFSPEQARGGYVDEKSDIYSLGITMYEMVTNTVPFQAESPVTVAIQHIKEELPRPSSVNKDVTESIEAIILKATQKKPERRYQTAYEIIDDMKKALRDPNNNFVVVTDAVDSPTINITGDDLRKIKEETDHLEDSFDANQNEDDDKHKKDKIVVISAVMTSLIIISILFFLAFSIMGAKEQDEPTAVITPIQVPTLIGEPIDQAVETVNDLGLQLKVIEQKHSKEFEEGIISDQVQQALSALSEGDVVEVTISLGPEKPEKYEVPSLVNRSYDDAKITLKNYGLEINITTTYSDSVQSGYVISQSPLEGTEVERGETISLLVSKGEEGNKITVPDLKGLEESAAIDELSRAGLTYGKINYKYHDTIEEGLVIIQTVEAGSEVRLGYNVDFAVSLGPDLESETENNDDNISNQDDDENTETTDGNENSGNENEEGQENDDAIISKKIVILDVLSDVANEGLLTVGLKFEDRVEIVYNEKVTHDSFPLELSVEGKGEAIIKIYVNGTLDSEDPITFEN